MIECTCAAKDMPFGRCCKAPAWHDAPNAYGWWRASSTKNLKEINEWNIHAYQHSGNVRWYGPLPEDKS